MKTRGLFEKHDTDRSGMFDRMETKRAVDEFIQSEGQPPISQTDFDNAFARFDIDRSGQLDFMEFRNLLRYIGNVDTGFDIGQLFGIRNQRDQRLNQFRNNPQQIQCSLF